MISQGEDRHRHVFDSEVGFVITSDGLGPIYSLQCSCRKVWCYFRPEIILMQRKLSLSPVMVDAAQSSRIESPYTLAQKEYESDLRQLIALSFRDDSLRPAPRLNYEEEIENRRKTLQPEPGECNYFVTSDSTASRASEPVPISAREILDKISSPPRTSLTTRLRRFGWFSSSKDSK